MNNFYTLSQSLWSKEDKTAFIKLLKTPLLLIMLPVLFVVMLTGLITGFFASSFSQKNKVVHQKQRTE